jgi:2-oxoglutarate ferredoxin oxidoreductase subunit alpha
MAKTLMKGNEALSEAAIRAGLKAFYGYPITPQNEVPAYMAEHLPLRGGVYLQAESEVSAINMVYGAAGAGVRVMTSSSSPGISLKQEGISYIAAAQLPCVIVNVVRNGPGLGGIQPAQGDYFQAVKGGGHGDYHMIVLAPGNVQEMADLTTLGFDLADKWRNPVMILGDGILGQMMEPVEFAENQEPVNVEKPWATTGAVDREPNIVNSLDIIPEKAEKNMQALLAKYEKIKEEEVRWQEDGTEDADVILVGYGTSARVARKEGLKVGLFRPITLWPFPEQRLRELAKPGRKFLAVEMSAGQMIEDVRLAVNGVSPVYLSNRLGGMVPTPEDVLTKTRDIVQGRVN